MVQNVRSTIRGVSILIAIVALLLRSFWYEDALLLAISLTLIILLYYDYHQTARSASLVDGISVSRIVRGVLNELEEADVDVVIENRSDGDIPLVEVADHPPKYLVVIGRASASMPLPRGESAVFTYKIRPLLPGGYTLYKLSIRVGGPLGFFTISREVLSPTSITVLPYYSSLSTPLKSMERLWGLVVQGKSTGGMYDLAELREYVPGDDYRKIVWKAYARTGRVYVREDFGEVTARVLLMLDIRSVDWGLGSPPNTLASVELRLLRSLVYSLARYAVPVDLAVCCSATTKVVRNATEDVEKAMADLFSYIAPFCSCTSPMSVYLTAPTYMGRSPEDYVAAILIASPLSIAQESPSRFFELVKIYGDRFRVLIPRFDYESCVSREDFRKLYGLLSALVERAGGLVELVEESFMIQPTRGYGKWR